MPDPLLAGLERVTVLGDGMSGGGERLTVRVHRVLPAPPLVVFRALTAPEVVARWWGPRGFTVPRVELDVRVGGRYRIAMQPPEGEPFHLTGEFAEVEPPVRLAYTFCWEPPAPDDRETVVVLTLEEVDGRTLLTVDQGIFATEARRMLHEAGWGETLDRLEEVLSAPPPTG